MRILFFLFVLCLVGEYEANAQSAFYLRDGVSITFGSTVTLNVDGNFRASDAGDTSRIRNLGNIDVEGNWINDGTGNLLDNSDGVVTLNGSALQTIQGSTMFYDLDIDNSSGVTINSGVNQISNSLTLSNGLLTTNDSLTLVATSSKTGRIPAISGGSITGDVIIECFVESNSGVYDYKFLGMPVQGGTLNEWFDDFTMTGFTGSQFPAFSFNSIKFYDETKSGPQNARYDSATNITNTVGMGVGVQVYTGGSNFMVDVKGPIYSGNINFPVSFTDDLTQPLDQDGWNLIANPYPSTIDWDDVGNWTRTNFDNAIYTYEPAISAYQSYVNGVGTNGGNQYIASSQTFFVKANAASPVLSITENAKTAQNAGFVDNGFNQDLLRLRLSNNFKTDDIVIRFREEASKQFDPTWDAKKILNPLQELSLTPIYNNKEYSILTLPLEENVNDIFLKVNVSSTGHYTLNVDDLPNEMNCLFLEDLFTGRVESLRDSSQFHFQFSDTTSIARFKLTISKVSEFNIQAAKCFGDLSLVDISANINSGTNLKWAKANTTSVFTENNFNNKTLNLTDGQYFFESEHQGCLVQMDTILLSIPSKITALSFTQVDSGFGNGMAWLNVSGGTPPYQYLWNDPLQQISDTAINLKAGLYNVIIEDANACIDSSVITIGALHVGLSSINDFITKIFPNPTKDYLQISTQIRDQMTYEIVDVNGRIIDSGIIYPSNRTINLKEIASGIYLLRIKSNDALDVFKIKKID